MNLTFVGTYLDKEFIGRYSATLFMDGRSVRIVILTFPTGKEKSPNDVHIPIFFKERSAIITP